MTFDAPGRRGSMASSTPQRAGEGCMKRSFISACAADIMTGPSILGILGAAALPWPAWAQSNDSCVNALPLPLGGSVNGTTAFATVDGSSTCGLNTPDVWYRVDVPGCGGDLTVYACPAAYDTVISLHAGCPGTSA